MMGMFDEVICDLPLPGETPDWYKEGYRFQTKSLDCEMDTYTISAAGEFSQASYTGSVQFYGSNVVGVGPGVYTRDGEDAEDVTYVAIVVEGKVTNMVQTLYARRAAFPAARQYVGPTRRHAPPLPENLTGMRLYVLYGGEERGYWVTVLLQRRRTVCVEVEAAGRYTRAGDLKVLDLAAVGHMVWLNEDDALQARTAEQGTWETARAEYAAHVAAHGGIKHTKRGA